MDALKLLPALRELRVNVDELIDVLERLEDDPGDIDLKLETARRLRELLTFHAGLVEATKTPTDPSDDGSIWT